MEEYNELSLMPCGKYQGNCLKDVPAHHLQWFCNQPWAKKNYRDLCSFISSFYCSLSKEAADDRRSMVPVKKRIWTPPGKGKHGFK